MNRPTLFISALALVLAACSGSTVEETFDTVPASLADSTESSTTTSDVPTAPSDEESNDGETATEEPKAAPEGPAAPDFTLALQPSGEFVLSQEVKPVYMVFWAEW